MAPKNPPGVARKQSQPVCRDPKNTSSGHKSRFSCFLNAGKTAPPDPKPGSRKPNDQTVVQDVFFRQISALQKACPEAPQDISPTSPLHPLLSLDRRSSHSDSTLNIISGISNLSSWDVDDELMAVSMLEMAKTPNNVNTTANNKPAVKQREHSFSESGLEQLNPQPWHGVDFEHYLLPPNTKQVDAPTDALPAVRIIAPIKNRDPSPVTQRQGFSLPSTTRSRVQSSVKRSSSSTNSCHASSKAFKINTTKQQLRKTAAEKKLAAPRFNRFGGIYIGSHFAPFGSAPREGASQKTKLGAKEGPKGENRDEPPNPLKWKPNAWKRNNSWKKPGGLLTQGNKTMGGPFPSSANQSPMCARPNITSSNVHSQPGQDRVPKFHGASDHERRSQHYLRKPFWKTRGHSFKSKSDFWRRMLKTHKSKFLMASSRLKKRVDWSTDSGYAESAVSSHDWLTGWGVSKEEMLLTASNDGIKSLQASLGRSLSHSLEKKTNRSVNYSLSLTTVKELSDNTSRQTLLSSNKALRKRSHSTLSNQKTEKAPVEDKIRKVMMESHSVYSTDLSMNVSDTRSIRSEWTSNGLGTTIASEWDSLPGAIIRYCDGDTEEQVTVLQRLKTHVFNIRWSCGNACPDGLILKTQNVPMVSFSDISDYALQIGNSTDKSQNQETYMPVVKTGFNSNTRRTTERSCQDSPALTRRSSAILSEAIFSQNTRFFSLECLQQRVDTTSPANSLDNIPVPFVGENYFTQAADKMGGRNGAVKRWLGAQEAHGESLTQTSYGMVANFTRNLWVKKALYRLRKKPNEFKRNQESGWKWPIFLLIVVFIIFMCLLLAYMLTTSTLNIKNTAEPLE